MKAKGVEEKRIMKVLTNSGEDDIKVLNGEKVKLTKTKTSGGYIMIVLLDK